MKLLRLWFMGVFFVVTLFGCGGGSGGSSSGGGPTPFVSWSSIVPPDTVKVEGFSKEEAYTRSEGTLIDGVSNLGISGFSSATLQYDSQGIIEQIDINTPNVFVSWDVNSGDLIEYSGVNIFAIDSLESDIAVAINPLDSNVGWEYQTFGVWETGRKFLAGNIGAMSMGAPTPASSIPLSGVASFAGSSSGIFVDTAGNDYFVYSDLDVAFDFEQRQTIRFFTNNSVKISVDELISAGLPDNPPTDNSLDLSGTLSYNLGANIFTGDVTTPTMSGTTTGQFYGPNAEELGGVFSLTNDPFRPTSYYSGAYGAAAIPSP